MCAAEPPDQEPDAELIREVYARFGAAYYFSEVLHRGLSNAYVIAPFAKPDGVTGPRVDERMWDTHQISIPAAHAKDAESRRIPFEPKGRLAQLLKRRRFLGANGYAFGTPTGQ
jgi:hypothetical protein